MLVGSNTNSPYLCNCDPQLPPKAKETEKMLMIQRWIYNLPMPHIVEFINKKGEQDSKEPNEQSYKVCHCGSLCPQSPPSYDEPENVPPPGKIFSARAPFTAEDHKIFTSSCSSQQQILSYHNILKQYYCNHQSSNSDDKSKTPVYPAKSFKFSTFTANTNNSTPNGNANSDQNGRYSTSQKRLSCSRASPSPPSRKYPKAGNKRVQKEEENPSQVQNLSNSQLLAQLSDSQQTSKDSRHFTLAETNLVVELFEDYFNYPGELPSLAEVRNRIGPTFLIQTRSAVSIRAKIKRLYSSGSWTKFKKNS